MFIRFKIYMIGYTAPPRVIHYFFLKKKALIRKSRLKMPKVKKFCMEISTLAFLDAKQLRKKRSTIKSPTCCKFWAKSVKKKYKNAKFYDMFTM